MAKRNRLLSISYDEALLKTRHYIFQQAGFEVISAYGFTEATALCKEGGFDVVVLGHAMPPRDKTQLLNIVQETCSCPTVSIGRPGQAPHQDADYSVDSADGPEAMVAVVKQALEPKTTK